MGGGAAQQASSDTAAAGPLNYQALDGLATAITGKRALFAGKPLAALTWGEGD